MSPSGQLPPNPNLRQLHNQAKDLYRAYRDGDKKAIERIRSAHPRHTEKTLAKASGVRIVLADAQLVIARELGFDSWPQLQRRIGALASEPVSMHELVTGKNRQAMEDAVAVNQQSVNQSNQSGLPPLYTAARCRNQLAIDFLLDHGAAVDIFACAYLGRAAEAEALLKRSPELVRATTQDGMTALHYAARAGHYDVVDLLLRRHADVNARDSYGRTAVVEACHGGPWKQQPAEKIVQLLLNNNAQLDLFSAAAMGRVDLIETLLDQTTTLIDALNGEGKTALFVAARNDRLAAVKVLVERGADVNRSDAVGTAALHRTSQQCSDELIRYLIGHGADAHLCCYVACGDEEGTRQALARDPDSVSEVFYEFNAVGYAIHSWQPSTLRILLQHGGTLSEEDQRHILRITRNDRELLDELVAIQRE